MPTPDGDEPPIDAPGDHELAALVATARAELDALRSARIAWLGRAADEDDELRPMLANLAEDAVTIAVDVGTAGQVVGTVVMVGRDVVGMRTATGAQVLIALVHAGAFVVNGTRRPTGDRTVAAGATLHSTLDHLASIGARVRIRTVNGGEGVAGTVERCGRDVLTVRADGDGRYALVPHHAIVMISVEDRIF